MSKYSSNLCFSRAYVKHDHCMETWHLCFHNDLTHSVPSRLNPEMICQLSALSSSAIWTTDPQKGRLTRSFTPCQLSTPSSHTALRASQMVTFTTILFYFFCFSLVVLKSFCSPKFACPSPVSHAFPYMWINLDNITVLSKKLIDWLRYASTTQGGGASSGGFFTGSRSRQVCT